MFDQGSGFDEVLPEPRVYSKFIPRLYKEITVTFGDPAPITQKIDNIVSTWREQRSPNETLDEAIQARIKVVSTLQQELERLGRDTLIDSAQDDSVTR